MQGAVGMIEALNVTTERVDDIPILLAHSHTMGSAELLDEYFKPHGSRAGISLDWTRARWVAYILSEEDHCMNQGEPRVDDRLQTLPGATGQATQEQDSSDNRLAIVLVCGRSRAHHQSPHRRGLVARFSAHAPVSGDPWTAAPSFSHPALRVAETRCCSVGPFVSPV